LRLADLAATYSPAS